MLKVPCLVENVKVFCYTAKAISTPYITPSLSSLCQSGGVMDSSKGRNSSSINTFPIYSTANTSISRSITLLRSHITSHVPELLNDYVFLVDKHTLTPINRYLPPVNLYLLPGWPYETCDVVLWVTENSPGASLRQVYIKAIEQQALGIIHLLYFS